MTERATDLSFLELSTFFFLRFYSLSQGRHLGGAGGGGGTAPLKTQVAPPKPQEVTAAGFPLFLSKFKCVITLASHLVIDYMFFFFSFFM